MTTTLDHNSVVNQDIKRRFVDREVYYCVSTLVDELVKKSEHFPDYEEDLMNAFRGAPDYEETATGDGWHRRNDCDHYYNEDTGEVSQCTSWDNLCADREINLDEYDDDAEDAATTAGWQKLGDARFYSDDGETSEADDWCELCEEQSIDTADYESEVYEHWIVSDYLADKLEAHGERVLRDFFGLTIWGRTTTGQAIYMDGAISVICAEMEILEGQAHSWAE